MFGAAGRGIGLAVAETLLAGDVDVCLTSKDGEELTAAAGRRPAGRVLAVYGPLIGLGLGVVRKLVDTNGINLGAGTIRMR